MSKYKQCKRCIMDNTSDKTIKFDDKGCCNYCNEALERKNVEYFPFDNENKIEKIFLSIKDECKYDKYDCIVGISGGIDSSYILYLTHKYGLRVLAIHIDDGLDNPIATSNINKLIKKTNVELITIKPNKAEYSDLLKALFSASVPNLAIVQDNLIMTAIQEYGEKNKIKYIIDGANFAHECILERGTGVNTYDKKYILSIQNKFGTIKIKDLKFTSMFDRYIKWNYLSCVKHIKILNYINYNLTEAIEKLNKFCDFEYYGGKHYESILTRFMQCYYLPTKFKIDKRKSHYSSLIVSEQITRKEALKNMAKPLYLNDEMLEKDIMVLCEYMKISRNEFESIMKLEPKQETSYKHSVLNELAPIARKFRKIFQ